MKLFVSLVALLLVMHHPGVGAHSNLRNDPEKEENNESTTVVQRFLTWGAKKRVDVCRVSNSTDAIITFRTVRVKRNKIQNDDMMGTCEKNCNKDKVCPQGLTCTNGQCDGVCVNVDCLESQSCSCQCVSEINPPTTLPPPTRKLTWPGEERVRMCHIVSRNPTTFSDINVRRSQVGEKRSRGDFLGRCSANCDDLCPNEECNLEDMQCGDPNSLPTCTLPATKTCPGAQCVCTCSDA